jgi:parvulin-like peptidyl-prolyl isomerase
VPNGFVLFRVLTRTEGDRTAFATQKDQLRETLRQREADRLTRAYLQQLRAERKIEVNEALLGSYVRESQGNSGRRS